MASPDLERWSQTRPKDVARWLGSWSEPWWIAGGFALELFLGRPIRDHADLDVGVFRDTQPALHEILAGFEFYAADRGVLHPLEPGQPAQAGVHSLWCRREGSGAWQLEIFLEERDAEQWVFRRDRELRLPREWLTRRDPAGLPYLRPEIQLLYKAKARRERDETDFRAVVPALDLHALAWLREALAKTDPGHEWLERLRIQ